MGAVQETVEQVRAIDVDAYKYGFVTDIESEKAPKGLDEDIPVTVWVADDGSNNVVRVSSEPAKGAVFTITLPVDASASHNPDRGDPK